MPIIPAAREFSTGNISSVRPEPSILAPIEPCMAARANREPRFHIVQSAPVAESFAARGTDLANPWSGPPYLAEWYALYPRKR